MCFRQIEFQKVHSGLRSSEIVADPHYNCVRRDNKTVDKQNVSSIAYSKH